MFDQLYEEHLTTEAASIISMTDVTSKMAKISSEVNSQSSTSTATNTSLTRANESRQSMQESTVIKDERR